MIDLGYDELLAKLTDRFGITLTCFNSGGGCLIWEARLEDGSWLWITDWDAGIHPRLRRLEFERQGIRIGWHVGIYANQVIENYSDDVDSCTALASVVHRTAGIDDLPDLIELALRSLPSNTHYGYDENGVCTIHNGIQHY
jgi:hypothetical protein